MFRIPQSSGLISAWMSMSGFLSKIHGHSRRTLANGARVGYYQGSECCRTRSIQESASQRWTSSRFCARRTPSDRVIPIGSLSQQHNKRVENRWARRQAPEEPERECPQNGRKYLRYGVFPASARKEYLANTADTIEARTWETMLYAWMRPSVNSYGYSLRALALDKIERRKRS